jgi:glucosamine--fructose-6-phosphate aminotransferase (isomerizing)
MCGIVGYVGPKRAVDVVLEGLRLLEYRGYDSAGVAVVEDAAVDVERRAGKLSNLEKALGERGPMTGTTGIGHTRWATHGAPTDRNAHPHKDCSGKVAVVHNGTIENFAELRHALEVSGHQLHSETDTEAVAHMVEERYTGDLVEAVRSVSNELGGSFVILVAHADHPDLVVGARRGAGALVAGKGDGESLLASDPVALIGYATEALALDDGQLVELTPDAIRVTTFAGDAVEPKPFTVETNRQVAEKGGYRWHMLKEIDEQPAAVRETLADRLSPAGLLRLDELALSDEDVRDLEQVIIVACGSAYHSGMVGKYAIERWTRIPTSVEIASEFRYRDPVVNRRTLVVAVSQSGETADTLEALRHARQQRAWALAVTNTVGSTVARESDAALYTRGGPEIAVASTKAVMTQVTAMYLVGLYLAQVRGTRDADEVRAHLRDLQDIPALIEQTLARMEGTRQIARDISGSERVLFIGRHVGYPMALEGALKLKELAYVSAEGFPAGEIKHGPIALVDDGTPVVVLAPRHALTSKLVTNVQELRARGARTIVVATDGDDSMVPYADHLIRIPDTKSLLSPLLSMVPMQVLAAEFAAARGLDVDQPRNLAKSVTVE